jgi:hypothetical protein
MCRRCDILVEIEVWCGKQDGRNNYQNVLVRKVCLKYIVNHEVHFVGYLYVMDLINSQKMEHIKIL